MAVDQDARQKKIRTRSPAYPYIDLRAALEKATVLWKVEGRHPAVIHVIMQHWGYKEESSTGYSCVAALKKFGLVDHEGMGDERQIRLSNLALAILLDDDPNSVSRQEALKTAALNPRIHAELWDKYGPDLPSDQSLKRFLVLERSFNETAVDEFLDEYKQSISFAGLTRPMAAGSSGSSPRHLPPEPYEPSTRRQEPAAPAYKAPLRPAQAAGGGWMPNTAPTANPAPINAAPPRSMSMRPESDYDDEDDDWAPPAHTLNRSRSERGADAPSARERERERESREEQRELLPVEAPRPAVRPPEPAAPSAQAGSKELPVPLDNDLVARVPYPMSEEDFTLLIETLQLWKKRLIRAHE
jgi:hypothetical protein